jgi:hypothetical protein
MSKIAENCDHNIDAKFPAKFIVRFPAYLLCFAFLDKICDPSHQYLGSASIGIHTATVAL